MKHQKMIVRIVILLAFLAMTFTGDTGNTAISARGVNPAASRGPAQIDRIETQDDRMAAIARQVPGFGGMFYDQDGTMKVYMVGQKEPANDNLISSLDDVI